MDHNNIELEFTALMPSISNLKDAAENIKALWTKKSEELAKREAELNRKWQEFEEEKTKVVKVINQKKLKLNVGGTRFETTLTTLTSDTESMLAAMFSGRYNMEPDEDGEYFIDRDGSVFGFVLNYLRDGGSVDLPPASKELLRKRILREAQYFQLTGLVRMLSSNDENMDDANTCIKKDHWTLSSTYKSSTITLSNGSTTATKDGSSGHSYVLGTEGFPSGSGVHCWSVTIHSVGHWIMFGIGQAAKAMADASYTDPTCYAIAANGRHTAGKYSGEYISFQSGDRVGCMLDCDRHRFVIVSARWKQKWQWTDLPSNIIFAPHFNLYNANTSITVTHISFEEFNGDFATC